MFIAAARNIHGDITRGLALEENRSSRFERALKLGN
jgi:hypothetical protein